MQLALLHPNIDFASSIIRCYAAAAAAENNTTTSA
jgi:hypothetical protein